MEKVKENRKTSIRLNYICCFFCLMTILSGCSGTTTQEYMMTKFSLDLDEFRHGYEDGSAFAKTESVWRGLSKNVPSFMEKTIANMYEDYQKGFAAGYRDQIDRKSKKVSALYWGTLLFSVVILSVLETAID